MSHLCVPVLLFTLVFGLSGPATAQLAVDYFPLSEGSYWEYQLSHSGALFSIVQVEGQDSIAGNSYTRISSDDTFDYIGYTWYRVDGSGSILNAGSVGYSPTPPGIAWDEVKYPANLFVGQAWTYYSTSCIVESDSDIVSVPAGDYESCLRIRCSDDSISLEWLAAGVGLVKQEILTEPTYIVELASTENSVSSEAESWGAIKSLFAGRN